MHYLTEINNKLPIKGNVKNGYIFIPVNYTSLYNNFKRLEKLVCTCNVENRLHVEIYNQYMYIVDLKTVEGIEQFYGLQLQKELDLQKQVITLKETTKSVLEKAIKLKEN